MSSQPAGGQGASRRGETSSGGPSVARWELGALAVFLVIFAATALFTGEPSYIIPVVILAALVFGYALLNRALAKRVVRRDGSMEDAMSDNEDPIPSAHLMADDETPLGDTPEAHDEISPHDLPKSHPGRQAAEEQAGTPGGTTRGHADPSQAPPDAARG